MRPVPAHLLDLPIELPCAMCGVLTRVCFLELSAGVFDDVLLCPGCVQDAATEHDEDEENGPPCTCAGGCAVCLGLPDRF